MKAIIGPTIWADPDFESLSCEAKLVVFWLLTSSSRDNAGVVRISNKRISFECSIPNPEEILQEALSSGSFEMHGDRIWIKNWITKQIGSGHSLVKNNMMKSVLKCIQDYPPLLQDAILVKYPELREIKEKMTSPLQGAPKGVASPSEGPRKGKERKGKDNNIYINNIKEEEEEKIERVPANKIDQFCERLAKLYGSNLNAINPESKRILWDRGITKKEEERVLLFVKKHRAGKLKDEHPIATTANRALLNIGDLIERAFACNIGDLGYQMKKAKPIPLPESDPTPLTEDQKKEIKEMREKLKKGMI